MTWLQRLAETYESCADAIGDKNDKIPLLPICHTTQNAQIEIILDGGGHFLSAKTVDKATAVTIIPCTEKSSGRTSGQCPHPLHDKLEYVAANYTEVTGGKCDFSKYFDQLGKWVTSSQNIEELTSVYEYVKKGCLIEDLIESGVLHKDENGMLLKEWSPDRGEAPKIFKLLPGGTDAKGKQKPWQGMAFVRFCVESNNSLNSSLQSNPELWKSWSKQYSKSEGAEDICMVSGSNISIADQHPAKIRNAGDKAKIISANDTSGFAFRGKFLESNQACSIGFELSQKGHSALRWLLAKQGRRFGDQQIVSWATSGQDTPDPFKSTFELFSNSLKDETEEPKGSSTSISDTVYTAQQFAEKLNNLISGYSQRLDDSETNKVVIMSVDSATPGRMAIRYYRELRGSEFLERIRSWHESCAWYQYFGKNRQFIGAPSPRDIAQAAYGKRLDSKDKLLSSTVSRILPCILDSRPIPEDLVICCCRRATQKVSMPFWEWSKALGIACALFKKQNQERKYAMEYEENRNTRDYLYGSLLAVAEHIEERALYLASEKRDTNAAKLMQRFAERPYSTWRTIELQLAPYQSRLKNNRSFLHKDLNSKLDEIHSRFISEDYVKDAPLSGEFLLGYHTLRKKLWEDAKKSDDSDVKEIEENLNQ